MITQSEHNSSAIMSFKKLSFAGGFRSSGVRKTSSFSQKMGSTNSLGSSNEGKDIEHHNLEANEEDILKEFETLLENMNLTEDKKEPLRKLPINTKREMLAMNTKTLAKTKDQAKTKLDLASDYIDHLSSKDLPASKILSCIASLKVSLTNNSLEWVQQFGNAGLTQVLRLVSQSLENEGNGQWEKIKLGCVKCLKSIMNNKVGLQNLLDKKEALKLLAR